MITELLKTIPDKNEFFATTSHVFKKDVWEFCNQPEFKELTVVELGTSNGFSTNILSYLFDNVITVNNNESKYAKEFNKDRTNITYLQFDLYKEQWQIAKGDVFFIDADHSYDGVMQDVSNALNLKSDLEKKIFIFDDYGVSQYTQTVRLAVDTLVNNGVLEVLGYIGQAPGWSIDGTSERTMLHYEGIICQEI
jgi:hypothetical protein